MTFRFTADIEFDAEDLDYAFLMLARHFRARSTGGAYNLDFLGDLKIEPVPAKEGNA